MHAYGNTWYTPFLPLFYTYVRAHTYTHIFYRAVCGQLPGIKSTRAPIRNANPIRESNETELLGTEKDRRQSGVAAASTGFCGFVAKKKALAKREGGGIVVSQEQNCQGDPLLLIDSSAILSARVSSAVDRNCAGRRSSSHLFVTNII